MESNDLTFLRAENNLYFEAEVSHGGKGPTETKQNGGCPRQTTPATAKQIPGCSLAVLTTHPTTVTALQMCQ